jgi:SAM-dependent methyltransferase
MSQALKSSQVTERAFFNQQIANDGGFNPFTDVGWQVLADSFVWMVRPTAAVRILEVGCGTGESRRIYIPCARYFVGVDLSDSAVAHAHRAEATLPWLQADANWLPFGPASFDVVAFSSTLHHIPDHRPALREARRVLAPGGKVFAFDPNLLHPGMAVFRHPRSPLYSPEGVSPNERPLLPSELRASFDECGFVNIRQRCRSYIPYRSFAPRLLRSLVAAGNTLNWLLDWVGLGRWLGTFVLTVGEKKAGD